MPQLIVIFEVFISQAQSEDTLLNQFQNGVLCPLGIAMIGTTLREALQEVKSAFDLPQQ